MNSRTQRTTAVAFCCLIAFLAAGAKPLAPVGQRLVVHEWGTFTALQDDDGTALPGINVDDEPLPPFVHNLSHQILAPATSLRNIYMKGVPQRHPFVTLRLETPVVYFYPPAGRKVPLNADVHVEFRGGWLTQFYPQADAAAPGLKDGEFQFGPLDKTMRSTLSCAGCALAQTGTCSRPTRTPGWLRARSGLCGCRPIRAKASTTFSIAGWATFRRR